MQYNIEFLKVSDLKPYENNVKKHDEEQIEQIMNSIKEFGFRQNLVIDENNVVIIGHGRLAAAEKMGLEEVPCVRVSDLTEEQIKALRIADNKLSEKAVWDNDALGEELKAISEAIDMTDFGFGDFELEILTGDFEPDSYDEDSEDMKKYMEGEKDFLIKQRVIISFTKDEKEKVAKLLGIPEIQKVVYDYKDIMALRGE